jgi:hypothetical protein
MPAAPNPYSISPSLCSGSPSDLATLLRTLAFSSEVRPARFRRTQMTRSLGTDQACFPSTEAQFSTSKGPGTHALRKPPKFIAETGETDIVVLQAAILHDTVEDTDTTIEELEQEFGPEVAKVVEECTDEPNVGSFRSKQAQVKTSPFKSSRARTSTPANNLLLSAEG